MKDFADQDLAGWLRTRLQGDLPGRLAHREWSSDLTYGRQEGPATHNVREAATIILLYQDQGEWYLPLTVRPSHLPDHAGQVSLPGGVVESGETAEAAALRELEEELQVSVDQVSVLGPLSPLVVFVSNFRILPHVGIHRGPCEMRPNEQEVARLLKLPLSHLVDPGRKTSRCMSREGVLFRAAGWWHQQHFVWGATAMILGEFIALFEDRVEED
jgi:8-oxo-dGTP pyrophosphatase MutT (NUDIX family)